MKVAEWADRIAPRLEHAIADFPSGIFDSFEYTRTGQNLTHPLVLGVLTKVLWETAEIWAVGVDVRLNLGNGVKMQPDLVAYDKKLDPVLLVDYESPNSSDARIPFKDVDAYCIWNGKCGNNNVPYIIFTTLPNKQSDQWELRYASGDRYNARFKDQRATLRANPQAFWYSYYKKEFASRCMDNIALVNIDSGRVTRLFP